MPQTWRPNWGLTAPTEAEHLVAEQRRERYINRIGNLTLVTPTMNPILSNARWAEKKPELAGHTLMKLSADILSCDSWDEEAIEKRGRDLAAVAIRIWPRPA